MASERPPSSCLGNRLLAAGRRDESGVTGHDTSAIFSLEMLVSDRRHEERADAPSDDSGLIDLAALTARARQPAAPSPASSGGFSAGGLFPEAPPPAPAPGPLAPVPGGGNRRLVLALSAAVTVLFCALVFQIVRLQGAASRAAPTSVTAADTPPTGLATAEPAPPADGAVTDPSSLPPAQPTASASAQASAAPTSPRPLAGRPPKPAVPPPVAPPPARSGRPVGKACPCPPEDLICQMRCATSR